MSTNFTATFATLIAELKSTRKLIEGVDPNSIQADDLAILEMQIQRKLNYAGFEPLSALPTVGMPDFTALRAATADLKKAIADEQKRVALVGKIFSLAKGIATTAGIPLPFASEADGGDVDRPTK